MSTSTNVKIGKQPIWNDELQYLIFGTDTKINLLMADRLACHNESATQLFVEAEIDLTRFLGTKGNTKNTFSNWYNLTHDGKSCGTIHFCFEFEGRPLTPEEQSMECMPMEHMYDYVFKQWAHHAKSCDYHESHNIPQIGHVHEEEKHNLTECYAKANSLGFSLKENTLIYKGEEVATGFMDSYYEDDDDYVYYDCMKVYVSGDVVGVRGRKCEVGADRPGLSWLGTYAYSLGCCCGDKFVKNSSYCRDLAFE